MCLFMLSVTYALICLQSLEIALQKPSDWRTFEFAGLAPSSILFPAALFCWAGLEIA
jgi:hypothetical protein